MMQQAVLTFTPRGLYCPGGDFYIDPWRPVDRALITHGHADHARTGHKAYLAASPALPVLRTRLGTIAAEGLAWALSQSWTDSVVCLTTRPAHLSANAALVDALEQRPATS